jgi:hypothetical protein
VSTTVQFAPSTSGPFTFQPVIGGVQYNATVTWNVFAQRYYLNLFDTSGNRVLTTAIVATGPQIAATLTWNDLGGGIAQALTASPHNVPVGRLVNLYISQTDSSYDGAWQALATGPNTITFALSNPNESQPLGGQVNFNVNLVQSLGSGWLVYRYETQVFEFE